MEQLSSHLTDFHEFFFFKSVEKIQVALKSDKKSGTLHEEDLRTFVIISRSIRLRMRNVSDKFVAKIKTHFRFHDFFSPESRAVYEKIWEYIEE